MIKKFRNTKLYQIYLQNICIILLLLKLNMAKMLNKKIIKLIQISFIFYF